MRSRWTWARSYWACCTSQLSSLPPKTLVSLTAISGDMPRFPFTSSERVLRVTPRAAAASVMVNPKGSMHSCNTTKPGCGGFFMVMDRFLSVVIDIIDIFRVLLKAENHTPISAYRNGPALEFASERVQPEPRQIHVGNASGGV